MRVRLCRSAPDFGGAHPHATVRDYDWLIDEREGEPLSHECGMCDAETHGGRTICSRCSADARRYLTELDEWLPKLSALKKVSGEPNRAPGFRSQSPADDAVLAATDVRSGALSGLSAVATIHGWAQRLFADRDFTPANLSRATDELRVLRENHEWIVYQDFAPSYVADLREIRRSVRALAGNPLPRSVGACIKMNRSGDCGGTVYEMEDSPAVQCDRCRWVYDGMALLRFRQAQITEEARQAEEASA